MKRGLEAVLLTVVSYAIMELWIAFRPADLSEQLHSWMETTHGKFEIFYAERRTRNERNDAPPLGN